MFSLIITNNFNLFNTQNFRTKQHKFPRIETFSLFSLVRRFKLQTICFLKVITKEATTEFKFGTWYFFVRKHVLCSRGYERPLRLCSCHCDVEHATRLRRCAPSPPTLHSWYISASINPSSVLNYTYECCSPGSLNRSAEDIEMYAIKACYD